MTSGVFLELLHVYEAVEKMIEELPLGEPASEERVVLEALGRVSASDVEAPEDLPGFERSSMDGFAVKARDTFGASEGLPAYLRITGEVEMGGAAAPAVGEGEALRISTGGVMPDGADAVVMVENTDVSGDSLEIVRSVAPGENVIRADDDIAKGSLLLAKGREIHAPQAGSLAAMGIHRVRVYRRPLVGVLSTGDELVAPDSKPAVGQVRDVNTTALLAAVRCSGCAARSFGIVKDMFEDLLGAAGAALSECDALLMSGGSSAGVRDLTAEVMEELGRPGVLAHGLYLRPGKPTLLAVCDGRPVIGLPGNPASALVVFREVVAPVLGRLRGLAPGLEKQTPRVVEAILERSVASATGRMDLVPVALEEKEGTLAAIPIEGRANLIGSLARADGQVRIAEGLEGLEKGSTVTVELLN